MHLLDQSKHQYANTRVLHQLANRSTGLKLNNVVKLQNLPHFNLYNLLQCASPSHLRNLISVQSNCTRSSNSICLARSVKTFKLKISNRSFRRASSTRWNQLPTSLNTNTSNGISSLSTLVSHVTHFCHDLKLIFFSQSRTNWKNQNLPSHHMVDYTPAIQHLHFSSVVIVVEGRLEDVSRHLHFLLTYLCKRYLQFK